jgi:hypothetical protein
MERDRDPSRRDTAVQRIISQPAWHGDADVGVLIFVPLALSVVGRTERGLDQAAAVKPWVTDRRLEAAGLLALTSRMHHARDAARHALFALAKAEVFAHPLSRAAVARDA